MVSAPRYGRNRAARPASPVRPAFAPLTPGEWAAVVRELELAPQEARVIEHLLQGARDKQVAATLGLSVATVRTYLARVFRDAGVADRVELILLVITLARQIETASESDVRCQQD